jgi:hypothetical protein
MPRKNDRTVFRNEDGKWVNKKDANARATSLHDTQKEAVQEAKEQIKKDGGGEITVIGVKGVIVSKDTVPPGHDPNPPKDREH